MKPLWGSARAMRLPLVALGHLPHARQIFSGAWTVPSESEANNIRCAIDLNYGSMMNMKEQEFMAQQMQKSYGANRNSAKPLDLYFSGVRLAKEFHPTTVHPHHESWECKFVDLPAFEAWQRDELIMLSPDAKHPLLYLDPTKVYVIAGLIDRSVIKNCSLTRAQQAGVPALRLPLREFAQVSNVHPIMDLVTMVKILCEKNSGASWAESFALHIPERHISRRRKEAAQRAKQS
ncbi:hypothetical protein AB1Y20_015366 [Prymnesium parvum]|uniref:tRNA (guanine(9)-N(1))-methyltransferase n=1 Tax=Prymnesium parvum TaxID=97485 RepID=A0AB34K0C0_PRYPA